MCAFSLTVRRLLRSSSGLAKLCRGDAWVLRRYGRLYTRDADEMVSIDPS